MKPLLLVSLDFELFWGMQDAHTPESYEKNVLGGRKAIPLLLDLFDKYNIHATWATVGFQFAKNYQEVVGFFPDRTLRPFYQKTNLSSYRCFESLAQQERYNQLFYAQELIEMINHSRGQEIGSHTFSHYYCRESGQTIEQFHADMQAAVDIANNCGISLKSMVFPRNQSSYEYLEELNKLGFKAFRDEENDWIHQKVSVTPLKRLLRLMDVYVPLTGQGGYIPHLDHGLWNLMGSRMYKPIRKKLMFLEGLKIQRFKRQMEHAARNGLIFHLWWHPHNIGVYTEEHLKQLEDIFKYYEDLHTKYGMDSLNMGEAVDFLENNSR